MKKLAHIFLYISALIVINVSAAANYETQQWQTSKGVRVVFYPAMEVPMVDISVTFAAGSAYDGERFGISALTAQLINQGNNGLNATQLAEKIEKTGAQFSAQSTRDMLSLNLRTLSKAEALKEATDAMRMIINHPDFPEDAFVRAKNQQLIAIKQTQESPEETANQVFFKALYGNHPYAHPTIGDAEHVKAITLQQVRDFYHQYFVGKNAVLVMVGALDSKTAHEIAENITAPLPEGQEAAPIPTAQALEKSKSIHVPFPSSQTMIRLGQLGISHQSPYYFPLLVGNNILGGGSLVSILAIELREKRGLTYGAYSLFSPMPAIGPFAISLSTRNKQAPEAVKLTRDLLTQFIKSGPSEAQLKATKQYLTGSFPLSLASNRSIADVLQRIAFYHLPNDYLKTYLEHINQVSAQQVKEAFQHVIHPSALLEVSVGKS